MTATPPDQAHRRRISDDLDATLFVEAGAGSGKTTALVQRVLSLVTSGRAELRAIAAVTFTEKAAAELRDRIRQGLEAESDAATDATATDPTATDRAIAERCRAAVDQLDGAAIGTLHAFAQRILAENPIEAGLPPRVEVFDEVTSEVEFEHRWTTFRDELLAGPALERTLLLLFAAGVKHDALRTLAIEFDRNWDLVDERVPVAAPEPPPLLPLLGPALDTVEAVCARVVECTNDSDKLCVRLGEIAAYTNALRGIDHELDLLDQLTGNGSLTLPSFNGRGIGIEANWTCDHKALRADVRAAGDALEEVVGRVKEACARRIGSALRAFTLGAARSRQAAGRLAFHDLLVLARALVRHPDHGAVVRQRLHRRYQRVLLDEFQDTDPIQVELAVRIAAAHPAAAEAGTRLWDEVPVEPGALFVVGDPKQSIYRFRRADITLFLAARHRFGADGHLVSLSTNFRTGGPVIDWVNHAFALLMGADAAADPTVASQPDYVALHAVRPEPPVGPAVSVIARTPLAEGDAATLRTNEAREVAATIARAVGEGWSVGTGSHDHPWRRARLGDITVLVPARTSLPFLEDSLDEAGIAYRAESSSLVYVTRAVRDLLMALRAVDDPTDHLSIVAALRSPLFACGDDDLFTFKVTQRGHWNYLASQPDTVTDGLVSAGIRYLRELHGQRHWRPPGELLDRIARDRRLFELGFAEGRTRDVWRRLRFVIDQAREWSDATGGGLRQYLDWVNRQSKEGSRTTEAVLPESDDDAVRIMTIHAAKGLEFPITIVSGMSTVPQSRAAPAQVAFPPGGGVGYRFGRHVSTQEFEDWKPIEEQMGFHERIRLLYVACTRAQDHLVLSLQRRVRSKAPEASTRTNAELLVEGTGDRLAGLPDAVDADVAPRPVAASMPPEPPPPFEQWEAELTRALRRGSLPTTVAATALTDEGAPDLADAVAGDDRGRAEVGAGDEEDDGPADAVSPARRSPDSGQSDPGSTDEEPPEPVTPDPRTTDPATDGLRKRPRDLDLPPWLKGRYGTAVGRAVHATLQTLDLATGEDLDGAVAAQCEAEAIPDRHLDVAALVRAALASPVVEAAASGPYWREVYACTPTPGGRLLEGYIDLLYRSDAGLVVVDYKTAATSDRVELSRRAAGYRLQGASYARTVAQTTGEPIARVTFVFLTPDGAVEVDLADVADAVAEVEHLVEAGTERVLG